MDEFKALCSKGDKAFKRNQLLQAITCYSDALTLSSDDTEVLGCRSVVYAKLGMFNESKKDAESLISFIPESPKGHYLRGVALENLGNYTECLKSYLKAYEIDVRCPTELLLSVVQVVGCVCQLSESEELTLSEPASTCQKFETLVHVGKRLYKTGNYKVCITVITTALKAHYRWNDKMFYSELTVENMRGRSFVKQAQKDTVGFSEDNLSSLPSPNFGFSSIYLATANQGCENDRNGVKDNEMTLASCRSIMSGLLVMGEAHYCLHQYKEALAVSKQCLSIALDLKDKEYEIKSYVKLANISIRLGQYVYAVSCNAKLLAVGRDLQTSSNEGVATYTDFWSSDVERRAVWNLSAAYKLMGNYKKALDYAQEYMDVLKCIDQENLTEAFSNLGELELLLGNHEKSLEYHKIELQLCKKFNDSHRMAYAYGNIGVALANTGSFNLAAVNHEQHLKLAQTLNDKISELVAIRNFGCLFRLKGEHLNALGYFEQHLQLAKVSKLEDVQCKAYHLIGACYCDLNQLHHAQYYYELCLKLAEEQSDLEQELETRFALAHITKSMRQFETSRQHFNKVIPALEQKLLSTHGRSLLHQDPLLLKLEKSYTELQEALAEMNLVEEALEIAEHCRSRILMNILRQQNVLDDAGSPSVSRKQSSLLPLSAKDIIDIVTSQQALVLFYSVIPSGFLTWLISPSKGIVKFHWDKSCSCITFEDKVELCVEEVYGCCGNSYKCDHRALPEEASKKPRVPYEQKAKKSCTSCEFVYSCKLTALQKLYHLLVIPVEDELHMASASGISQLIVVPDLSFNSVPFPSLQDQSGQYLYELFHVRILPCIRTISLEKRAVSLSKTSEEQVVDCSKILVIGNPTIPDVHLNGQIWSPINQSDLAEEELNTVASLLGVDAVTGTQATKDRFLKSLPETSVVHLVTYGSWTNACLALSPSPHCHDNPPSEESFLVTMSDISYCKLSTKLVVLNAGCGCGHQYCYLKHISFNLATALVAAGVQSVVVPLWSVPQALLLNLFYQFYSSLEAGKTVSESLKEAWTQVRNTEHMSFPDSWASYVHFGFDTTVDLTRLRHDLFDGVLDRVVDNCSPQRFPLVTAKMLDNKVPPVTVKVKIFQDLLTHLLLQHRSFTHVLPALTNVVQLANQMLLSYHHPELLLTKDLMMCAQLSSHALEAPFARDLLTFLGFDFQKDGARDKDPFVVFPHWDPDGALSMASQVLEAACDIFEVSSTGGYALAKITKTLKKNTMEKLKEFLSLSCRYPERILKTNDFVLHSLWFNPELQRFLASLGFYEVGHSLLFNKTEDNQSLLRCSLRIVSALLDYVEKGRIRTPSSIREISSSDVRSVKLASLSPQLTPSKQIVMGAPWMSTPAGNSENILKIALSKELEGINKEFAGYVTKSNYWHAELLRAQSCPGTSLPLIGSKEKTKLSGNSNSVQKAGKVKVHGGLTPSCNRRPVEEEPRLSINATRERRNEIYRIYAQRFDDIAMHKRQEVRRLFMSQIGDHG